MANLRGTAGTANLLNGSSSTDKFLVIADETLGAGTTANLGFDGASVSIAGKTMSWDHFAGNGGSADRIYGLITSEVLLYQNPGNPAAPGQSPLAHMSSIEIIDMGIGDDIVDMSARPGTQAYTQNITLMGGDGNDIVRGGAGSDILFAGIGVDVLEGGLGNDRVDGGDGNDRLSGNAGNDDVYGGTGNDFVFGGSGNDQLHGSAGNDILYGQTGNDVIWGNDGVDRFVMGDNFGQDTIRDFRHGSEKIEFHDVPGIDSFGDLDISRAGASTIVHAGAEGSITLNGVAAVSAGDFLFT